MREVVIVSAARTPVGKFLGSLSHLSAVELGTIAIRAVIERATAASESTLDPSAVTDCVMGCVLPAGLGQNPARQAALRAGLSDATSAFTVNMVCGSGLKAIGLAAHAIAVGDSEIAVAGGMESMSNAPYLLPKARTGLRMGDAQIIDSMIRDGLWCALDNQHMGMTAELVAEKHSISREQQDEYALNSHRKAAAAQQAGRFDAEIVPVAMAALRGAPSASLAKDESVRPDASLSALATLRPAFKPDGTVTAGNAPGMNDAAAAVLLMSAERAHQLRLKPLATIRAQATSGVAPRWVMLAPVSGVQKLLARVGWSLQDVDLFELNEAFSVQALGVTRELGLSLDRVNVNGGAVAIGHPIGASGARILVTLLHEMERRDVHKGVAALCLGGGNSVAMALER
ncbi:MAG: thiolase family protein [Acidobacteriaceae bacterium]